VVLLNDCGQHVHHFCDELQLLLAFLCPLQAMVAVMTVVKQGDGRCRDLFVESVRDASQDDPFDHFVQVAY
jgi:hypothetical protein